MNIMKIVSILETLSSAGLQEVVIEPIHSGIKIKSSSSNNDCPSLIVCCDITDIEGYNDVVDKNLAVSNIDTFLSKMSLLDLKTTAINIQYSQNQNYIHRVDFSCNNKELSNRFSNPQTLSVPREVITDNKLCSIYLDNISIKNILSSVNIMKSKNIMIESKNQKISFKIYDENNDKFSIFLRNEVGNDWSYLYNSDSIKKLLKLSLNNNLSSECIDIGKSGLLYIVIDHITFILLPQVE